MERPHILGSAIIVGASLVLSLLAVGVVHHPASVQGSAMYLLLIDVALLVLYGAAGVAVWRQRSGNPNTAAATAGAQIGLVLGAVQIANHLLEAFVWTRPFVLVISPVLLMLTLLGAAGAAAWERTRSLFLGVVGAVWCAIVAALITLIFAICFNLSSSARVDWELQSAFAVSGMSDPGDFRVRNIVEASSEVLVQLPLFAICLGFAGAAIHAWMSRRSRRTAIGAGVPAPLVFAVGAFALWHANALERAARPPFVMAGLLLSGFALCTAYPIWSILLGQGITRGE